MLNNKKILNSDKKRKELRKLVEDSNKKEGIIAPALDITKMNVAFIRSINPERVVNMPRKYMPFDIFMENTLPDEFSKTYRDMKQKWTFRTTDFNRGSPITYLKLEQNARPTGLEDVDLWAYTAGKEENITFKPLMRDRIGFTTYVEPTKFFIEYLEFPTFMLYIQSNFGEKRIKFLRYAEKQIGKKRHVWTGWTYEPLKATRFVYPTFNRSDTLIRHIPAHTHFTSAEQKPEKYKIAESGSSLWY